MKIIGIIAEYNPFHNGHAYQVKKIKEDLHADFVIVAMSGDFVQRGAPAIIDKYSRTQMALSCGADLVFELPVLWATASAEYFAAAGVALFDKMGCVDGICFGAESNDLKLLTQLADILIEEPEEYRVLLSSYLKDGLAFPTARSKALCQYLTASFSSVPKVTSEVYAREIFNVLNTPNNILAIEYLKALKRRNSSMTPYVIKREGAGYHEESILSPSAFSNTIDTSIMKTSAPTASATAIRKALHTSPCCSDRHLSEELAISMPMPALAVLKEYMTHTALVQSDDFSSILGYKLLSSDIQQLADIGDSNQELANRLFKNRINFTGFEPFCELNKSKNLTYTRISRILLHFILNINNQDYSFGKELDYIPYLRMLGFRKDASMLLKTLKKMSAIPIISKLADAGALLDAHAMKILKKDIFAADLYSQICANKHENSAKSEYSHNLIIL